MKTDKTIKYKPNANLEQALKTPIPNQKKVASTQKMQSSTQNRIPGTVPNSIKVVLTALPGVPFYPTDGAGRVSGGLAAI